MRLVVIESPYAGDTTQNVIYARRAMANSFMLGEAPFASHLFYTPILDDTNPVQRALGIEAGFCWGTDADLVAFYVDYGYSRGMIAALEFYRSLDKPWEERRIGQNNSNR